jgi:hypothetical protein
MKLLKLIVLTSALKIFGGWSGTLSQGVLSHNKTFEIFELLLTNSPLHEMKYPRLGEITSHLPATHIKALAFHWWIACFGTSSSKSKKALGCMATFKDRVIRRYCLPKLKKLQALEKGWREVG